MSAPSLAVSASHGVDVAGLNAFLAAALQRVVREAVLVQAPASASVVPSAGVVDTGVSGGIAASVAGSVGELAAVCRESFVVGAAGRRSSAGGAASCQVMSPGLSSVVSSTLVEGAHGASNLSRPALLPSSLHFRTPAHQASGELDSCELGVFRSHSFLLLLLRLIFNKHPQIKNKNFLLESTAVAFTLSDDVYAVESNSLRYLLDIEVMGIGSRIPSFMEAKGV